MATYLDLCVCTANKATTGILVTAWVEKIECYYTFPVMSSVKFLKTRFDENGMGKPTTVHVVGRRIDGVRGRHGKWSPNTCTVIATTQSMKKTLRGVVHFGVAFLTTIVGGCVQKRRKTNKLRSMQLPGVFERVER